MKRFVAGAVVALVALSGAVAAHHSPAVFDQTKTVELKGTVKAFKWQNPHTFLDVEIAGAKGAEIWTVEMTSPTYLLRAGWKNNSVKPGDKVSVKVHPVKEGDVKGGIFVSITLADGRTLTEKPARLGAGSDTTK
jgi:hypothetical protein